MLPPVLFPRKRNIAVERVPHHLAHAAYAFYASPFEEAAALVVDGSGERESISVFRCNQSGVERVWSLPFANSPGFFYEALTRFVGMAMFDEGKTMGLAPYGTDRFYLPSMLDTPPLPPVAEPDAKHYLDILKAWQQVFEKRCGIVANPRLPVYSSEEGRAAAKAKDIPQIYRDVAYAGQRRLEEDLLGLARQALQAVGTSNLVVAGGVALNCVANGYLAHALEPSVTLYVPPAAGDAGISLGAALYLSAQQGHRPRLTDAHVFSGPHFSRGDVADLFRTWGLQFEAPDDVTTALVEDLAEGRIVGFVQGRAELGPRALGARSLLADPSRGDMHARMNKLKKREAWRPLAPSVPVERVREVFGHSVSSPFMLMSYPTSPAMRLRIPAVVHVDGSTRPQVVDPNLNAGFYRLLDQFARATGTPALLNTSFNVDEPMVATPAHAVRTFTTSAIDTMAIEGLLVRKAANTKP